MSQFDDDELSEIEAALSRQTDDGPGFENESELPEEDAEFDVEEDL